MPRERSVRQPGVDQAIARVASGQRGVVDIEDLRVCGLSKQTIAQRVRSGRLFPLYRGVYATGHANLPFDAWCFAAVRACGPESALSHYAATVLWGMLEPTGRYPDVVAPSVKRRDGINTFRAASFERTIRKGIPVTTPAQTVVHLSSVAPFATLRRAVNEGLNRKILAIGDLIAGGHRGAKKLRAVLATAAPTRSENENLALQLLHEAGIATPLVNPSVDGTTLIPDFLWPDGNLILEADSERHHGGMLARADDRAKQAVLEGLGYRVIRTSWAEMTSRPDRMIRRVRAA
ncbi:type IV toxin-antitoxin system AbiEi family antitoxin domain-containing protein [Solirubrobacter pauli]|uniref:type IV toxin-antitoxin system AbiEi family antitoxin domain-containing protein n=1 Tax=Solirubrobacter pauli TaxID=166793 RepID=UPI000EB4911C|nr:type IV toxin-antitoxin system AbiEi family antitoxin domain-containing protein [Solirubrobacter pauli]